MSCEYCDGEERLLGNDAYSNAYIRNRGGEYQLRYIGINCLENPMIEHININYCPMCGSKLGDSDD